MAIGFVHNFTSSYSHNERLNAASLRGRFPHQTNAGYQTLTFNSKIYKLKKLEFDQRSTKLKYFGKPSIGTHLSD